LEEDGFELLELESDDDVEDDVEDEPEALLSLPDAAGVVELDELPFDFDDELLSEPALPLRA
jgi:hypothetical protein